MKTESTVDTAVVTSAISRTASGRWRARNMMSTAPTKGYHVMIDSAGNGILMAARGDGPRCSSQPPLGQHEQHEDAHGDAVDIVLGQPALQPPQPIARAQRPRAQQIEDAVHDI